MTGIEREFPLHRLCRGERERECANMKLTAASTGNLQPVGTEPTKSASLRLDAPDSELGHQTSGGP
jgi:hypothetical protein